MHKSRPCLATKMLRVNHASYLTEIVSVPLSVSGSSSISSNTSEARSIIGEVRSAFILGLCITTAQKSPHINYKISAYESDYKIQVRLENKEMIY